MPVDTMNQSQAVTKPSSTAGRDAAWPGAAAVMVERLGKARGDGSRVLASLSLRVGQGEFFGLLGPIGSGKTTLTRILAGILLPDAGQVSVLGYDVRTASSEVRSRIGYVSQHGGIDDRLTGRENVLLLARLHGLRGSDAERRTDSVLALLDIVEPAGKRPRGYSRDFRKRVTLACALVHRPRLLVLDDPTDGLDPAGRATVWQSLRSLNRDEGVTVLLATQQLEEAEGLCDRIAILDGGRVIASGSPAELKAEVTGTTVTIRLTNPGTLVEAAMLLERVAAVRVVRPQRDRIELEVASGSVVGILLRLLEEHEIQVRDMTISKSSLDEVFFRHTGRTIREPRDLRLPRSGVPGRR